MRTRRGSRRPPGKRKAILIAVALLATVAIVAAAVYGNDQNVRSRVDEFIGRPGPSAATATETPLDIEGRVQAAVATARTAPSPAPDVRATTEAAIAATVEALRPTSTTDAVPLALASTPTPTPTKTPTPRPAIATRTPTKTPAPGPTIPTRTPTKAPTTRPPPTPTPSVSLRDFTNGRWLEQEDPRLASSIRELGWIQDGIDGTESEAIQDLLYIAVTSRSVVSSLVSLGWVQDGISDDEAEAIDWINNMSGAEVMSAVVALGWVQDGIDDALEIRTIEKLSYIAYENAGLGLSVVALGWVQDGIEDIEARAIDWISNIEGAEVMSAVVALGWVRDGINDLEVKTIEEFSYIAYENAELGLSVVALGWVQDGIEDIEARAIDWISNIEGAEVMSAVVALGWVRDGINDLEVKTIEEFSYIAYEDAELGLSVVALGWVQDGIEDIEARAIDWISNIGSAEVASAVVALGWVRDGINDLEVKTIEELSYIAYENAELGLSVVALGWVQDGIEDIEARAIDWISNIGSAEVASAVVALGWVQDGIDDHLEVRAIGELSYIAYENAGAASWIVVMPFVETIEPPDVSALQSLSGLVAFEPKTFEAVRSHAALRDGISNDLAPIVATLHGVAETNPGLINVLLDPNRVSLEERTISLPLAGDVILAIIRTRPSTANSMNRLEHAVRTAERFMGLPLPTNYVGVLYENAVPVCSGGANFGTHIALLPENDIDDGNHEAPSSGRGIPHEVAHYYWSGNADWMDEGAAGLMGYIIEGARTGKPVRPTSLPCAYATTIAELEGLGISLGNAEFGCNYSLGDRLFVDLYRTLGDEQFRQGFRALYRASEMDHDDYRGTSVGIEHIRRAFRSDDGAERAVIARWYDGTEAHDLSQLDDSPVDHSLPSINGRIDEAYIVTETDGPAVSTFSARDVSDWVYLTLTHSYSVSGGPREVSLEVVEYFEDGFEFGRHTGKLTAEPGYIAETNWFAVGSPPSEKWAPGRYFVYVYVEGRKVAEVAYEVLP